MIRTSVKAAIEPVRKFVLGYISMMISDRILSTIAHKEQVETN
jgi:hypothetical protein